MFLVLNRAGVPIVYRGRTIFETVDEAREVAHRFTVQFGSVNTVYSLTMECSYSTEVVVN